MRKSWTWAVAAVCLASSSVTVRAEVARPVSFTEGAGMTGDSSRQRGAAGIAAGLARLSVVGRVLYVAAHPDDENTRLLAYLVGARGLSAGYLSMTRGDGGQNLVGTEQDELLGVLRTEELLAARRVDGAEQYFTRARDFGYSKSAKETMAIWGEEAILGDVVRVIRRFRPDVILTRFSTKPPNHGHHTASALLAEEAFAAAADGQRFPAEAYGPPWRADRLLWNTSTWSLPPGTDMSGYLSLDVGGFDPLTGRSWGEVAAASRSQHRSQGFGVAADRGPAVEYFTPLLGEKPRRDLFEGLELGWKRYPKTARLRSLIAAAEKSFDFRAPHKIIPQLVSIHRELGKLPDENPAKAAKLREVEALVLEAAGLFLDVRASAESAVPGRPLDVKLLALARSPTRVVLRSAAPIVEGAPLEAIVLDAALAEHRPFERAAAVSIPAAAPITTPYWLREPKGPGRYEVGDPRTIGLAVAPAPLVMAFVVEIGGAVFRVARPVLHVEVDPVEGEVAERVEVVPAVTTRLASEVVMVPNGQPVEVPVVLVAGVDAVKGEVRLELPPGWRSVPERAPFHLERRGAELPLSFKVTQGQAAGTQGQAAGTQGQAAGTQGQAAGEGRPELRVLATVGEATTSWQERSVRHPHIPPQAVRSPAVARLVPVQLARGQGPIAYIPGPGDRVAECLEAVGYDVTVLGEDALAALTPAGLDRYAAVLVGVRAFNASERLGGQLEKLLAYVERGGRLVVQYNTNSRVGPLTVNLGPHPLEIGRDRVTDETAEVTRLDPADAAFRAPNLLRDDDFAGWVQERGLYFAAKWDPRYRPLLSLHDPGEPPLEGALLVAQHGKGTFIYTGLSFFRQLPAGVPGAYRLLANLLVR